MAKPKETTHGIEEVKIQRLTVPQNLTRKRYVDLRLDYMQTLVTAKKALKKAFDIYKEELSTVMTLRRKINDSEDRLVEVYDLLDNLKLK